MLTGKQLAGTSEAGRDFIQDQQYRVGIAQLAYALQVAGRVKTHPPGTLHNGFHDNGCNMLRVFGQRLIKSGKIRVCSGLPETTGRRIDEQLLRQHIIEETVHAGHRVTHRHGSQRIAVVATSYGEKALLRRAGPCMPVLHRHLHGDLD